MKERVWVGISLFVAVIIGGGSFAYQSNIENKIVSEIEAFDDYVDENGGGHSVSKAKAMHNFIESYSHKNDKVQREVLYHARSSVNDTLESYFEGGHTVIESLEAINSIMKQPYINPSLIETYNVVIEEARGRRNYITSLTDEDREKIKKYNASLIEIGYTESQVVEKLGNPYDTTTSTSAYSVTKVFEYDDKFIYFEDGIVTRVVDF